MRKLALIAVLLASPAAADVSLVDNHETVTVDCAKDPNVSIAGNHETVTLTGVCKSVMIAGNSAKVTGSATSFSIAGNKNTVDIDGADTISITGNDNTVSYKKAADAKKKAPKVSNLGTKNTVKKTP